MSQVSEDVLLKEERCDMGRGGELSLAGKKLSATSREKFG